VTLITWCAVVLVTEDKIFDFCTLPATYLVCIDFVSYFMVQLRYSCLTV